jgi:hypothetical protein
MWQMQEREGRNAFAQVSPDVAQTMKEGKSD